MLQFGLTEVYTLRYLVCCKMQKELLGNVVFSIKINALTRSQIATANVLLNEI